MSAGKSRIVLIAFGVSIRLAIIAWITFSLDYDQGGGFLAAIVAMIILSIIFAIDLAVYIFSSRGFYRNLPAAFRTVYGPIGAASMVVTVYLFTAIYFTYKTWHPNNALQRAGTYKVQVMTAQLAAAELRR